jgi:hydrogenase-4 component E
MHGLIDMLLVLILVLGIAMLSTGRVGACIRISAAQAMALSLLPFLVRKDPGDLHTLWLSAGTFILKVLVIPYFCLYQAIHDTGIRRETKPMIGYGTSLVIAGLLVASSFMISDSLPLPDHPENRVSTLLIPTALSTVLIGQLILVSRTLALTQVLGYIVLENGIFLFGLALVREMPLLVEMGILLDVFVGVFIMAIVVYHISRTFDHIDTQELTQLKD